MASLVMSGLRAMDTSDSVQRLMRYSMSPRGVTEPETNESVDTVDDTSQSPQTSTHKHKHNLKATRPKQQPQRESLSRLRQRVLPVGSAATAGAAASIGAAGTSNGGQQHRRPLDHSPRTEAAIPVGTFRALQPGKPLPQPPRHSETVQVRQMFARLDAMLDDPANRFMPFPGKGAGQAAPRSSRQRRSSTPGSRATAAASPNTRRRTVTSRSVGGDDTGDESDDSGATGERDAAATPSTPRRRGRGRDGTTATPPASSSRAAALAASRRRQRKRQHQGQRSVSPRSTASSPRPGTADSASGARKKSPRAESALDRAVDAAMLAVSGTQLGQLMGLSRAASPDTLAAANKAALEAERAADDAVAAVNSGAATASRTPQRPLTQQQQQGTVKGQAPSTTSRPMRSVTFGSTGHSGTWSVLAGAAAASGRTPTGNGSTGPLAAARARNVVLSNIVNSAGTSRVVVTAKQDAARREMLQVPVRLSQRVAVETVDLPTTLEELELVVAEMEEQVSSSKMTLIKEIDAVLTDTWSAKAFPKKPQHLSDLIAQMQAASSPPEA